MNFDFQAFQRLVLALWVLILGIAYAAYGDSKSDWYDAWADALHRIAVDKGVKEKFLAHKTEPFQVTAVYPITPCEDHPLIQCFRVVASGCSLDVKVFYSHYEPPKPYVDISVNSNSEVKCR